MIRALTLFTLAAAPAQAGGEESYRIALQAADREAQAEYDQLAPVDVGLGYDDKTSSVMVDFYSAGSEIPNVVAEIVAIYDDTNNICAWAYESDTMPSLPRTAALAVRTHAEALQWPAPATSQWASTLKECTNRTNLATSLGDLIYVQPLAVGPHIVYFGIAPKAPAS